MKKAIVISTLFVIFLLAVAPSIPAVQHTTIKETIKERYVEQLNTLKEQKEQKIQFSDLFNKEKLKTVLGEMVVIDFANIYLLICSLLITVFMGKPSLSRIVFNLITINTIIYEFKTGELLPRCSKFYPSLIAMPFLVLGSMMYSKTNSKAIGTMILLMSSLIYYAILIAGVNVNTT